jgi:hypothetical protein
MQDIRINGKGRGLNEKQPTSFPTSGSGRQEALGVCVFGALDNEVHDEGGKKGEESDKIMGTCSRQGRTKMARRRTCSARDAQMAALGL